MWFYTYLKHPNDVPSLRTHIQSSNVFLRLWPQYYLPEGERRSLIVRLCHVVYYLGTLLFLTALTSYTTLEIPSSPSATVEVGMRCLREVVATARQEHLREGIYVGCDYNARVPA